MIALIGANKMKTKIPAMKIVIAEPRYVAKRPAKNAKNHPNHLA